MPEPKTLIVFTQKADEALDRLLDKYRLKESTEEAAVKLEKDVDQNIVIIDRLTIKQVKENSTVDSLKNDLQTSLGVTDQIASAIAADITKEIIPLLAKVPEGGADEQVAANQIEETPDSPIQKPLINSVEENADALKEERASTVNKSSPSNPVDPSEKQIPTVVPQQKKGSISDDKYRESVT
jgi:hypothetical protein